MNDRTGQASRQPAALIVLASIAAFMVILIPIVIWEMAQSARQIVVKPTTELEQGVLWHEVDMPGGDGSRKLWIYLPSSPPAGKLPCIFIAPAGSSCITGMAINQDDQPEHTPYAHAGFIVVAYSLDGALPTGADNYQFLSSVAAFRAAHYGIDDEQAAVAYALRNYPHIDTRKLFVVGHSSAGTMALLSAEYDPRMAGCVAYAPVGDVASRLGQPTIHDLSASIPDAEVLVREASPLTNVNRLRCPIFIFHADDDDTVPTSNVMTFMANLHLTNKRIYYASVPSGGHYMSMRINGIPDGISWLKYICRQIDGNSAKSG